MAAAISNSGGKTQASRAMPSPRSAESRPGRAAASTTPTSPKPSRAAVSRVRSARIAPDVGAPGLVGDRGGGEAEVGQRQRRQQPQRNMTVGRIEQGDETQREGQQRHRDHGRPAHAVGQPAQPGVDAGIEQARAEQDGAEQGQFHAGGFGVEARHMDVDRQRGKGQRQAEQAVGEDAAAGHGQASGRLSKAARKSGALVRGSSQMAKKAGRSRDRRSRR